jgi:hypothetical protein
MTPATAEIDTLKVIDGIECRGRINTADDVLVAHIQHAIRQGHPQLRPEGVKPDRVAIVGSGPSLAETERELRDLVFAGAKVVALNGAYDWCLERNIHPSAFVMVDARASNARFVRTEVPRCKYFIASQCHPDVWSAVAGRDVILWHAMSPDNPEGAALDAYYGAGHWYGVAGGTTVTSRAICLLRMVGYLRFDLFGVDSCWLDGEHHAFPQAENAAEQRAIVRVEPDGSPALAREFVCAPWHVKQLEDFTQLVRVSGHQFQLHVHGRGLLAAAFGNDLTVSILEGV